MRPVINVLLILVTAILSISAAETQEASIPSINAIRTEEEITIDGYLREAVWQGDGYSAFIQKEPVEGAAATERTSIWVAYDERGIFVAAKCYYTDSSSCTGGISRRDEMVQSDWFWFWIDPNKSGQSGFGFAVNPDGSIIDRKLYQDINYDDSWDGVWDAAAKRFSDHWVAEIFIPFTQLRFSKKEKYVMGVNFERYILSKAEEDYFVMVPNIETGFVSKFGLLTGIAGIEPPVRLQILPYVMGKGSYLAEGEDNPFYDDNKYAANTGVDLKYGLTGDLTLDVTVNPDFGQAEVDPAKINLSAFETYYAEKRSFFIEGSDIFWFGDNPAGGVWGCNWIEPYIFYSRRIGRGPAGDVTHEGFVDRPEQTTIIGAAKMSGQVGDFALGYISAVTDREYARVDSSGVVFEEEIEPRTYYGVLRGSKEFNGGDQGLGAMVTGVTRDLRSPELSRINNRNAFVLGIDGWSFFNAEREWAFMGKTEFSHVNGTEERILDLQQESAHYYQSPDLECVSLDSTRTSLSGYMGRFAVKKTKGNLGFQSALGIISPGFETNDLGFTWMTNMLNMHVVAGYAWYEPTSWYRKANLWLMTSRNYDFDGRQLFEQYYATTYVSFLNYWSLESYLQFTPSELDLHQTRGGPAIACAGYTSTHLSLSTDERKKFRLTGSVWYDFVRDGGYTRSYGLELSYNPSPSIKLTLSADLDDQLNHQQWVANIPDPTAVSTYNTSYVFSDLEKKVTSGTVRLDWGLTPELSLQMYVQPYIAVGSYSGYKRLLEGGTNDFEPFDYQGPNPDFNFKSFKANVVLRWEYRPGSLIYLVWTHGRLNYDNPGVYDLGNDIKSLIDEDADNIFLVKLSYLFTIY
ncbi:MAG: carbohydrate binding family 9 domain-containing protein [candidate division WOR-3 bacterium]|nr:MAG: carbohydrate binding family 9 domain-containing protein [candidate division WOR-3 bacterium]